MKGVMKGIVPVPDTIGRAVKVQPGYVSAVGRPQPEHSECQASKATTML